MKGREHIVLISVFAYVGLLIPVGLYVLSLFVTRLTRRSEIHMIVVFLARDCVHYFSTPQRFALSLGNRESSFLCCNRGNYCKFKHFSPTLQPVELARATIAR